MLTFLRRFILGILGGEPDENLDGALASPESGLGKAVVADKEESTRGLTGASFEDASDLPLDMVLVAPVRTRSISEETEAAPETSLDEIIAAEIQIIQPRYLWCLDNGHGSEQAGKRSPVWDDGSQLEEWKFNRQIVAKIIEKLDFLGIQYFNVVPEEKIGMFIPGRIDRANEKESSLGLPKIYVSIHGNAAGAPSASGVETWYYLGSEEGKKIASVFQLHLMNFLAGDPHDWKDRGIRTFSPASSNFAVLRLTSMPAVLTENGFYSNEVECRKMLDPEVQQLIADAHVAAILEIEKNGIADQPVYPIDTVIAL